MFDQITEYPHDFFVPLEGDPYHLGRLTLNAMGANGSQPFNVEIDIVEKESKKIFYHVDILYGFDEVHEAVDRSVQKLSEFIKNQCKNM